MANIISKIKKWTYKSSKGRLQMNYGIFESSHIIRDRVALKKEGVLQTPEKKILVQEIIHLVLAVLKHSDIKNK